MAQCAWPQSDGEERLLREGLCISDTEIQERAFYHWRKAGVLQKLSPPKSQVQRAYLCLQEKGKKPSGSPSLILIMRKHHSITGESEDHSA